MFAEDVAEGVGDLAEGGAGEEGFLHWREEVGGSLRRFADAVEGGADDGQVLDGLVGGDAFDLAGLGRHVVMEPAG